MSGPDGADTDVLTVIYRGPLASCNYGCGYCPFAKRPETASERTADTATLQRFTAWCAGAGRPLSVLFTPWGEALHHPRYREAVAGLSRLPHVRRVAAQTNLAGHPGWLAEADVSRVGLWCTFHPTEVSQDRFVHRCEQLVGLGVRFSVGMVAVPGRLAQIEALRDALPAGVPLWLNALSVDGGPVRPSTYDSQTVRRLAAIDRLFEVGLLRIRSRGRACNAGHTAISVDGDGTIRRCHFTREVLGNLYLDDLDEVLAPRRCPAGACHCHLGYVHLPELDAGAVYGDGLLERVPAGPEYADPSAYLARARALAGHGPLPEAGGTRT